MVDCPDDLSDLLLLWWLTERGSHRAQLGMPRECPSTRGYEARSRWTDWDAAGDSHDRSVIAQAVGRAVDALPATQRAAAHVLARNMAIGAEVWSSSRLPTDPAARQVVFAQTIDVLMRALGLDTVTAAVA